MRGKSGECSVCQGVLMEVKEEMKWMKCSSSVESLGGT